MASNTFYSVMIMKAQTGMRMPPTGFISKEKTEQQKACCCEWEQ